MPFLLSVQLKAPRCKQWWSRLSGATLGPTTHEPCRSALFIPVFELSTQDSEGSFSCVPIAQGVHPTGARDRRRVAWEVCVAVGALAVDVARRLLGQREGLPEGLFRLTQTGGCCTKRCGGRRSTSQGTAQADFGLAVLPGGGVGAVQGAEESCVALGGPIRGRVAGTLVILKRGLI